MDCIETPPSSLGLRDNKNNNNNSDTNNNSNNGNVGKGVRGSRYLVAAP